MRDPHEETSRGQCSKRVGFGRIYNTERVGIMGNKQSDGASEIARSTLIPHVTAEHLKSSQWHTGQQEVAHIFVMGYVN